MIDMGKPSHYHSKISIFSTHLWGIIILTRVDTIIISEQALREEFEVTDRRSTCANCLATIVKFLSSPLTRGG